MVKSHTPSELPADSSPSGDEHREEAAPPGVLADLIEVEARVNAAVREAEADAERAVAAAREEIDARDREEDHALEAARRELREALEAERSEALEEIRRHGEDALRRHSDVRDERVDSLAHFVARRVAEDELERDEAEP